jgi:hypothetical protein
VRRRRLEWVLGIAAATLIGVADLQITPPR